MDPATVPPPSPPPPPQNPHTPTDALTTASAIDCFQKGHRSMENFKAVAVKLAGRLLPPNRSLIDRRFDDIVPHELLVPDHPPYADMILTALWELKAEGGSSEEDISHFIEKEYHELPWAHATILNYHLRDLCKKGTITMTRDRRYIRCSLITKPKNSPSPCPSSSPSSSSSDPSTSISTSPTSSSSSMSWGGPYQRKKRRKIKRKRGKTVQLRGRDRGQQRRRGRGRGRGRSGPPMMIRVGQRRSGRGRFDVEGRNEGQDPNQENEDQHEVTSKEVEDYSTKDKDLPDVIAKISEEESSSCEQIDKEQSQPQKKYNVTWIGQRARKQAEEAEIDFVNVQSDEEVTMLDVDVSNAKVDEHVEQLEEKEEKGATDMEHNRQEENQLSDIVAGQTLGEERVMNNENPSKEKDSAMMRCEAQVTAAGVEKQHGGTFEEQIQPAQNNDEFQTHEQEKGGDEQKMVESTAPNKQPDCLTREKVETLERSADLRNDDDDVTEEQIHPKEQCVEKTEESPQPCNQDQLKNVEVESAEQEEHQAEVNQKEIVIAEVQQAQFVEMVDQQNQPSIQQTEMSEKDSLQEKNNPERNEENTTSSGSTTEGLRRPSRPVLRSSSKKEDAAPNSKKQLELVTPVRRSLRSHKTDSEAAVRTEVSDHSKELVTHSGRTRSSKRKPGIAEAEQVSNRRKTRRTGL